MPEGKHPVQHRRSSHVYICPGKAKLKIPAVFLSFQHWVLHGAVLPNVWGTIWAHFMVLNTPQDGAQESTAQVWPTHNDTTGGPRFGKCIWLAMTELSYFKFYIKTLLKATKVGGFQYKQAIGINATWRIIETGGIFSTLMLSILSRFLNQLLKIWIHSLPCTTTIHTYTKRKYMVQSGVTILSWRIFADFSHRHNQYQFGVSSYLHERNNY